MITYKINKNKLSKKPIGTILSKEGCNKYSNIVVSYVDGNPILICTNLSQSQWNDFCDGKLSKKELEKYI